MKSTMLSLLKFCCDNPGCLFECWINRNNNLIVHFKPDFPMLEWPCPECKQGHLRYAPANTRFEFELRKNPRGEGEGTEDTGADGG
jgi:hypothetical protein